MSKADQFASASAFKNLPQHPRSSRRTLIDEVTGIATEMPPVAITLPVSRLARNPYNLRATLPQIQETADSLLERGQIQPITIVTKVAFLKAHPEAEEELGAADFVVIDGNRRLAAARVAGLDELRVDVNDDFAETPSDILETALIANIQREDLSPLEEANALDALVKTHGSLRQVARRVGKSHAWISQRLALLSLTAELQEKVASGELPIEDARILGKVPEQQQAAEAAKRAASRAEARRQGGSAGHSPRNPGRGGNGVTTPTREETAHTNPNRAINDIADVLSTESTLNDLESLALELRRRLAPADVVTLIALLSREATT